MEPSDLFYMLLLRSGNSVSDALEICREVSQGGDVEGALQPLTEADLEAMWVVCGGEGGTA